MQASSNTLAGSFVLSKISHSNLPEVGRATLQMKLQANIANIYGHPNCRIFIYTQSKKKLGASKPSFSVKRSDFLSRHIRLASTSASMSVSFSLASDAQERMATSSSLDEFVELAHQLADAAGDILLQYFRKKIVITDKEDLSPVTIADQAAEQAMRSLISKRFPTHAIFGEEWGLDAPGGDFEYVWVLDPIDGTKSYITGKPVFGTLICLVQKGTPILGIIDQPVLRERWVGVVGRKTLLNNQEIGTRACSSVNTAYLYTTSPHLFSGAAMEAFSRIREKVKVPLYGCDCYAYGLLAAGHVDLVIESGLKPYDFLALIPVVEGAGGILTDWKGQRLVWWPSDDGSIKGTDVIAAGDMRVYDSALGILGSS